MIRQEIFHRMLTYEEMGDSLSNETILEEYGPEDIVIRALQYISENSSILYYPGKSYAVAVTYALLLHKEFQEDVLGVLDEKNLLFGNDPYFKRYSDSKEIYDQILAKFPLDCINEPANFSLNFQKTHQYFYMEFLLHEKTMIYATP